MAAEAAEAEQQKQQSHQPPRKNNKVARASAAALGVSFIFGRFLGQGLENPEFCVVFVNKTMLCFFP